MPGEDKAKAPTKRTNPPTPPVEQDVPLDLIDVGAQQLRAIAEDDNIGDLAQSIARKGLLQPIGLRPTDNARFQLLWGSRRLAAHRYLNRSTIRARIRNDDLAELKSIALIENIHRSQLTLEDEVNAVTHLHIEEHRSPEEIATLLSKTRSWVMRRLALPNLPDDLRDLTLEGTLTIGAAESLALLEDPSMRAYLTQQVISQRYTITQTKAAVDMLLQTPSIQTAVDAGVETMHAQQSAPVVHLLCDLCHEPRPIPALRIVRICNDRDCQQPDHTPNPNTPQ